MRVLVQQLFCVTGIIVCLGIQVAIAQQSELGEGFFNPKTTNVKTLYLYDIPNSRAGSQERPIDSITFVIQNNHANAVKYAPKNFSPYHEKLDYGVFMIRIKKLGVDYHEVIIDENSGKTAYVNAWQGTVITWGQFFLNCHSVEFINPNQKVFDNPMITSAGRIAAPAYFKPRYIMGDWMEVEMLAEDYNTVKGKAWIRWKKNGKLLIRYNLFA